MKFSEPREHEAIINNLPSISLKLDVMDTSVEKKKKKHRTY